MVDSSLQSPHATPQKIRLSIASAYVLGLAELKIMEKAKPTTCYLMEYNESGCQGSCAFCSQTSSHDFLSRVVWPEFDLSAFLAKIEGKPKFGRYCIQCLIYPGYELDLIDIVLNIRQRVKAPISAAIGPTSKEILLKLKHSGLTDIGLSLDTATERLFNLIKNHRRCMHSWAQIWHCIDEATEIFGVNHVRTHIIVGLGESEKEICEILERIYQKGIGVSLFPFMPIKGTELEHHPRVKLESYRKLQLFKNMLFNQQITLYDLRFNEKGEIMRFNSITEQKMEKIIFEKKRIFQTNGCSACNRPYYTSKPSEIQYDYPFSPDEKELKQIISTLRPFFRS